MIPKTHYISITFFFIIYIIIFALQISLEEHLISLLNTVLVLKE